MVLGRRVAIILVGVAVGVGVSLEAEVGLEVDVAVGLGVGVSVSLSGMVGEGIFVWAGTVIVGRESVGELVQALVINAMITTMIDANL